MHTTQLQRGLVGVRPVVGVAAVLLSGGAARAQSIAVVQPAPGYQYSEARYAAPGGAVVGTSLNPGLYSPSPTRWVSVAAPAELLGVPGPGGGEPYRCSDDGQVVVGRWMVDQNSSIPAMWGSSGAYTALPAPPDILGEANGVSADGAFVTGWAAGTAGRWLLRWQNGTQTQQYGSSFLSGPCSPDGNTAIGVTYLGGSAAALARWTSAGGPNGSAQTLVPFPSTWTSIRPPTAMTPVGDAAVGWATIGGGEYRSWIWRNGQLSDMGIPAGMNTLYARGISGDGALAVGTGLVMVSPGGFTSHAQVWSPQAGWQGLGVWLASQGVSFPGWTFSQLYSVSADGRIFAGAGRSPQGQYRGFVITLPCYANCDRSTAPPVLNVADFVCFMSRFAAGDPYANCDGSTTPPTLNVSDFVCFQGRFGAGCS